jgi:hypothetical protein
MVVSSPMHPMHKKTARMKIRFHRAIFRPRGAIRSDCALPGALGPELSQRQICTDPAIACNHRIAVLQKLLQLHPLL